MEQFRRIGRSAARGAVSVTALLAVAADARAQECIQQKPLPEGCHQTGGMLGCTAAVGIVSFPSRVDLSPDDETAYVSSSQLSVFDRDPSDGTLTQLPGLSGCISDDGSGGTCTDARSFGTPGNVAITSDLATAYLSNFSGPTVFDRNVSTGALTQKAGAAGCFNATGADGCSVGVEMFGTTQVALSPGPDHDHVYAVSYQEHAVTVFDRDAMTGNLTQKAGAAGCINDAGSEGCTDGKALLGAVDVVVSPDGANVYVVSLESAAIAVFDRDAGTGVLTQKPGVDGCISEDGTGGECADGELLIRVSDAAMSPDGKNLYVVAGLTGSSRALTIFDRDTTTGVLTQKPGPTGCVTTSGLGVCINGRGFVSPRGVAVSADGLAVYMADEDADGISAYLRDPSSGLLVQASGPTGCANRDSSENCGPAVGMEDGLGVIASADGNNVYATGGGDYAVAIFDRVVCPPTTTSSTTTSTTSTTTSTTSSTTSTTSTTTTTDTTTTTLPEPTEACGETPATMCRDQAGVARLRMRDIGTPVSPTVEFVWKLGETTAVDELGDPVTGSTAYSLCVYANGSRVLDLTVPPGTRWRAGTRTRFRYYDGNGSADGVRKLVLQAGASGEAKVRLRARGSNIDMPLFPLTAPLRVQLVGDDGGGLECWEAAFPTIRENTSTKVEAQQ